MPKSKLSPQESEAFNNQVLAVTLAKSFEAITGLMSDDEILDMFSDPEKVKRLIRIGKMGRERKMEAQT